MIADGAKMSKSKGNVVGADDVVERFGADTARMFVLFAAPPEKDVDWTDAGAEGIYRFLGRVYRFVTRNVDVPTLRRRRSDVRTGKVLRKLHQTLRKITEDFETRWHFNTSIAAHHGAGQRALRGGGGTVAGRAAQTCWRSWR